MSVTNEVITTNLKGSFESVVKGWNGHATLPFFQKRKAAFDLFLDQGFPHIKLEDWKYTNLSKLLKNDFSIPETKSFDGTSVNLKLKDAYQLFFVNGQLDLKNSILPNSDDVKIDLLSNVEDADKEQYFARVSHSSEDSLSQLNTAFAEHGLYVKVYKGKTIDKPIVINHFNDAAAPIIVQPRILIIGEENAAATFVEFYDSKGSAEVFTNQVTELVLKANATLERYIIQNDSSTSSQVNTTEILHEGTSKSITHTITLGGKLIRNNLNITLNAEHSEGYLNGLYLLNDNQHVDNHSIADHAVPNCYSDEQYKGILDGKSTGVFNGKIFVRLDAQKTNAFQSNKNVLLSPNATMNTKPQLEIFADDVKCSHGATIGRLDKEQLFYLRSRGISEEQAKKILVHAYANDIIEKVTLEPLKELLIEELTKQLS